LSELQREDFNEILDEVDELHNVEQGLGFKTVMMGAIGLVTIIAIFFPRIYINSNIYFLSLEIGTLYSNAKSLGEERRFLEQKLEAIKYKQDVLNSLR
jgi:hypothetical protein